MAAQGNSSRYTITSPPSGSNYSRRPPYATSTSNSQPHDFNSGFDSSQQSHPQPDTWLDDPSPDSISVPSQAYLQPNRSNSNAASSHSVDYFPAQPHSENTGEPTTAATTVAVPPAATMHATVPTTDGTNIAVPATAATIQAPEDPAQTGQDPTTQHGHLLHVPPVLRRAATATVHATAHAPQVIAHAPVAFTGEVRKQLGSKLPAEPPYPEAPPDTIRAHEQAEAELDALLSPEDRAKRKADQALKKREREEDYKLKIDTAHNDKKVTRRNLRPAWVLAGTIGAGSIAATATNVGLRYGGKSSSESSTSASKARPPTRVPAAGWNGTVGASTNQTIGAYGNQTLGSSKIPQQPGYSGGLNGVSSFPHPSTLPQASTGSTYQQLGASDVENYLNPPQPTVQTTIHNSANGPVSDDDVSRAWFQQHGNTPTPASNPPPSGFQTVHTPIASRPRVA